MTLALVDRTGTPTSHQRVWWSVRSAGRAAAAAAVAVLAVAGCSDSTSPLPPVAGSYAASAWFTVDPDGTSEDLLAEGANISIQLAGDGSLDGAIDMPSDGGEIVHTVLSGTWSRSGSSIGIITDPSSVLTSVPSFTFNASSGSLLAETRLTNGTLLVLAFQTAFGVG